LKGLYWLILGLCVWFIPTIIFNVMVTSGESELTPEEASSDIPAEFVVILFAASLPLILKGVITIRKERKAERKNLKKDKKKPKKK
jgi:ABC-type spermidine/putrescine transport system permease subunit II